MNCLLVFTLMSVMAVCMAAIDLYPRGCIYINGRCFEECPVGTHAYTTGCGYVTPEPTCAVPNPVEDRSGPICDYSDCYCDAPTVRHPHTKKCVRREECPIPPTPTTPTQ